MNSEDFTQGFMEDRDEPCIILDCKLLEGKDPGLLINVPPVLSTVLGTYLVNI